MGKFEIGIAVGVILLWVIASRIAGALGWKGKEEDEEVAAEDRPRRRLPLR